MWSIYAQAFKHAYIFFLFLLINFWKREREKEQKVRKIGRLEGLGGVGGWEEKLSKYIVLKNF